MGEELAKVEVIMGVGYAEKRAVWPWKGTQCVSHRNKFWG